jgi:hypothetical protein
MSRKGNPWNNEACESFIKTLKYEEVYRTGYRDLAEAHASIRVFLEKVYNQRRPHSALGYLPPVEFEHGLLAQPNKEAASRRPSFGVFRGIGKSIHPMRARSLTAAPSPASASPAGAHLAGKRLCVQCNSSERRTVS